jgi:hypothetical protein
MTHDLTYTTDGLYTRFFPHTKAGEDAWREMAKADGVAAVLNIHAKAVLQQLRAAGYTVAKAKKAKPVTIQEIDDILNQLEA